MARDDARTSYILNKCPVCRRITGVLTAFPNGPATHEPCDACRAARVDPAVATDTAGPPPVSDAGT